MAVHKVVKNRIIGLGLLGAALLRSLVELLAGYERNEPLAVGQFPEL